MVTPPTDRNPRFSVNKRLARQMDKLQAAAIGEKSWLLKGEGRARRNVR